MDEAKRRIQHCIDNKATELNLSNLKLSELPKIPSHVTKLYCSYNQLKGLPELPSTLTLLYCFDNPFLYIPSKITIRFPDLKPTPNYSSKMQLIKAIYKSHKRKQRLLFCQKLQDQIDEYRYRPGNAGYHELTEQNKGKFLDLSTHKR